MIPVSLYISPFIYVLALIWSLIYNMISNTTNFIAEGTSGFGARLDDFQDIKLFNISKKSIK